MKLDLHVHSTCSRDATAPPKDVISHCKKLGLDGLAITDHNAIAGSIEAYGLGKEQHLIVVRGVEISTKEGHVLALGVSELVPRGLTVAETIEKIHSLGGMAVAAHPQRFPSGIGLELARKGLFDAIETINGGSSRRSNVRARRVAEERRLPVTAGSDAHELTQLGKAYTMVESCETEDDVIEAIRKGKTQAGGRSRTSSEGARYSVETLIEWLRGDFRRL
jgi:hypothetical protein